MASEHDVRVWHDVHYAHSTPETRPGSWQKFINVQDPYNTDNLVTGWVQMTSGDEYGNLVIESVNERAAPQRIMVTPKASYPYRRDSVWLLNAAEWIRTSTKYDGTNICQFSYADADGRRFTTFKLRVRPFVSAYFRVLLDRALRLYPKVAELTIEPGEAMIYELYGSHNPMLIIYKEAIELISLCRRNPDGDMEPADADDVNFTRLDCPLSLASQPSVWSNIQDEYIRRQDKYSDGLRQSVQQGEKAFYGHEGEMLYARFPDGDRTMPGAFTRLIKLKPPEIEAIHQALDHVPKIEAEATARNIFEVVDEPELRHLVAMLCEDWSDKQIERSMDTIARVLDATIERRQHEDQILAVYLQEFTEEQFRLDKGTVMRKLSTVYSAGAMQNVYTVLDARLP